MSNPVDNERIQHRLLVRAVRNCSQLMLCELLPPSNPYFAHLYVGLQQPDFKVLNASAGRHMLLPQLAPADSMALPGPSYGEIVVDRREAVEWRVSAGVNIFGDPIYIISKGMLIITGIFLTGAVPIAF